MSIRRGPAPTTDHLAALLAGDHARYRTVAARRDFYKWFYEHTIALGYSTRWPLAAWLIASTAERVIGINAALASAGDPAGLTSVELETFLRTGNQVIFDDVLPKLRTLLDGGPITGDEALRWDMRTLAEEQALVQPLYDLLHPDALGRLGVIARKRGLVGASAWYIEADRIARGRHHRAGVLPPLGDADIRSRSQRWAYGMALADRFSPSRTGYDPASHRMPAPPEEYSNGTALRTVNTIPVLHELDAWMNSTHPTRSRDERRCALTGIVERLSAGEREVVVADLTPDGSSYSRELARFRDARARQGHPVLVNVAAVAAVGLLSTTASWQLARPVPRKALRLAASANPVAVPVALFRLAVG